MRIYSYSQISQYLTCPRRYRHRYLDGWEVKEQRASMMFGRAFERALAALFCREDPGAVLFEQWSAFKQLDLVYCPRETWDSMLEQGIQLLTRFVQGGRVSISRPRTQQQVQVTRPLVSRASFVGYIDAIGEFDGDTCVLEWKTSSARYPAEPVGITALDPQLLCYSWMTGVDSVAQVVFVRKKTVEVQYLRAVITEEQRHEFEVLVEDTFVESNRDCSCRTAGFDFPRMLVQHARFFLFAWINVI